MHIRDASLADAAAISDIVVRNLSEVNAHEYEPAALDRLIKARRPKLIAGRIARWHVVVADADGTVVGTGALDADRLRMFFVAPPHHGKGVGTALLAHIEALARARGLERLDVASSQTAQGFYRRRGFLMLREATIAGHTSIVMRKPLAPAHTDLRGRMIRAMRVRRDGAP